MESCDLLEVDRIASEALLDLRVTRFDDPRSAAEIVIDLATRPDVEPRLAARCMEAAEEIAAIINLDTLVIR